MSFDALLQSEEAWFAAQLDEYKWLRDLETALRSREKSFTEICERISGIEAKSREISDRSRSLRLGVERQMTEQTVMESMVSEISGNLENYRKFPIAQKLVEERRVEEALDAVLASLKFFRSHRNFQEAEIFLERFGHLKGKILSILSTEEISDSVLRKLRSEIACDGEIGEFVIDYQRRFISDRVDNLVFEIANISKSFREEAASARSFVRKFLLAISDLCAAERELAAEKFGESEICDEIFRAISDQAVFEIREVVAALGDDLEKLRDVIEQIGNSNKFPDAVRLGLGALRKDLQERVAVSSVLNVRRDGGSVRRTLEILSLLVGILDERTFQSVANEAVSVVLDELRSKDSVEELEMIGNMLLLREHVAMLECDLVMRESEIVFPNMRDLFSAGIWNILTPKISETEIDVKAKIEDTLREASKKFVARTVQGLLQPVVESGKVEIETLGNLWKLKLPEVFAQIRVALSIGKIDNAISGAALAGPLMQELVGACVGFGAEPETAAELKLVVDKIYANVESLSKSQIDQIVAKQ